MSSDSPLLSKKFLGIQKTTSRLLHGPCHPAKVNAMFGIHLQELLIVLAIFMLLFGGAKIPQIARALGQSITEFKKGTRGDEDDTTLATKDKV